MEFSSLPAKEKAGFSSKALALSREILSISTAQILVRHRFLSRAIHEMKMVPTADYPLASDAEGLRYDPDWLLTAYKADAASPIRMIVHGLMHHLFRHMFISTDIDQRWWNLACDAAAEAMIRDMDFRQLQDAPGQKERNEALEKLGKQAGTLTAERLMRYFSKNPLEEADLRQLEKLFRMDDHALWYASNGSEESQTSSDDSGEKRENQSEPGASQTQRKLSDKEEPERDASQVQEDEPAENERDQEASQTRGNNSDEDEPDDSTAQPQEGRSDTGEGGAPTQAADTTASSDESAWEDLWKLEEKWREIAEQTQMEMEAFSADHGDSAGNMMQALRLLNQEKYDYTSFLRKFATRQEVTRLSPDEFDYVYYTYGLELYKNLPLIEPLEYREDQRIREFVIAIDTSGSVQGEVVQRFLQKTYNILKQEETFDRKFQLHLIQCDAQVQEDAVIHTQDEFDQYLKSMRLRGFGGTDFRPVFTCVNQLRAEGKLSKMKGDDESV